MRIALLLVLLTAKVQAQNPSERVVPGYAVSRPEEQHMVEVRLVTAPSEVVDRLKQGGLIRSPTMTPTNVLPDLTDEELQADGGIRLVSATTTVSRALPLFVDSVSDDTVRDILHAVQQDSASEVKIAPKVVLNEGQQAAVRVGTETPFVVAVKAVDGALERTIHHQNEGTEIVFRANTTGADLRLDLAVEMTSIEGDVTQSAGPGGVVVQTPIVKTSQVSLSALIADGKSLAIVGVPVERSVEVGEPILDKVPYVSRLFRNTAKGSEVRESIILITPRRTLSRQDAS